MTSPPTLQPQLCITLGDSRITLLGTAHVSRTSQAAVETHITQGSYDAVAVELCHSRYQALFDTAAWAKVDLFAIIKTGKAPMVLANLALAAYQQRLAEQLAIEPGAELKAAVVHAQQAQLPVLLIDREVGITLKRIQQSVPWWQRFTLLSGLFASLLVNEKISEEEIERLKEGDLLESTMAQFMERSPRLFTPLIDERDRYMAARIQQILAENPYRHLLVVIGAGHLAGLSRYLQQPLQEPATTLAELEQVSPPSRWSAFIPWALLLFVVGGMIWGFSRSDTLGWQLIWDWIWITGGAAAFGSLVAGAHPLTILSAFIGAPFTTLHPGIGIGMVTAATELWLRKPTVADFSQLRTDTMTLKGWWTNRVARILLIFTTSTLFTMMGLYIASARLVGHLAS